MSDCVDGGQQANLTNIDNGSRGTVYFDAFESRRETYIGLAYSLGAVKVARMAPEPAHPGDPQETRAGSKVLALILPASSIPVVPLVQTGKSLHKLASQMPVLSLSRTSLEHFRITATDTLAPITHRIVTLRWGFITLELPIAGTENKPALIGAQSLVVSTTITYTYDPLNRLKNADYNDGTYFHYTYDAVGNRLTETALGGAAKTYTYDAANRLTSADGVSYSWDNNGNLLDDGAHTYTYDHANRLAGIQGTGTQVTFGYNGLGDRLQQTANSVTTSYTLDLNAGLTQVLADGTSTYLYGAGRIAQQSAAGKQYFLGDALGSVRQLADATGAVSLARSYQPYGKLLASDGSGATSYGFTNEYTSQGLIYLRSRWYSPGMGRFISRDTWMGDYHRPVTLNRWNYGYSNPVLFADPTGKDPVTSCLAALGLLAVIDGPLPVGDTAGLLWCAAIFGGTWLLANTAAQRADELAQMFEDQIQCTPLPWIVAEPRVRPRTWPGIDPNVMRLWPNPEPKPRPTPPEPIPYIPPDRTPEPDRSVRVRHYSQVIESTMATMVLKGELMVWVEYPITTSYKEEAIQRTSETFFRPLNGRGGFVEFSVDLKKWTIIHDPNLRDVPNASAIRLLPKDGNLFYITTLKGFPLYEPKVNPSFYNWKGTWMR